MEFTKISDESDADDKVSASASTTLKTNLAAASNVISKGTCLLLAMVYAEEYRTSVMGQEGRDRTRIDAMVQLGYNIYTADNKHPQLQKRLYREPHKKSTRLVEVLTPLLRHCDTDFAGRGFFRDLRARFGLGIQFDQVILDYFFSPIGYAKERWTKEFFFITLPNFVKEDIIAHGGCVWLPYLQYTYDMIQKYKGELELVYVISYVEDPNMNPLFYATGQEHVSARLRLFPEPLVNENQIATLNAATPFISMTSKGRIPLHNTASMPFLDDPSNNNKRPRKN